MRTVPRRNNRERLECRVPASLRAQLVGLAAADNRSLNSFMNIIVEGGLKGWLDRERGKRTHDPTRPTAPYPEVERQLQEIKGRLKEGAARMQPPKLPDDLTNEERAQLGMKPLPVADATPQDADEVLNLDWDDTGKEDTGEEDAHNQALDTYVENFMTEHGIDRLEAITLAVRLLRAVSEEEQQDAQRMVAEAVAKARLAREGPQPAG